MVQKAVIMTMMTAAFAYGGADIFALLLQVKVKIQKKTYLVQFMLQSRVLIIAYIASLVVLVQYFLGEVRDLAGSPLAMFLN